MEKKKEKRKTYPSDLSEKEWEILKLLLPEPNESGNRKYELREKCMEVIMY